MEQEADGGMTCNNNFGLEMGREIQVDMKAESLRQASTVGFKRYSNALTKLEELVETGKKVLNLESFAAEGEEIAPCVYHVDRRCYSSAPNPGAQMNGNRIAPDSFGAAYVAIPLQDVDQMKANPRQL